MPPVDRFSHARHAVTDRRTHLATNTGVPGELWPFSCYCGTRLTIEMLPGTRKECLCGAVHEFTERGTRII